MLKNFKILLMSEDGQGMVEYTFILALVGLAAVTALGLFGEAIPEMFSKAIEGLTLSND